MALGAVLLAAAGPAHAEAQDWTVDAGLAARVRPAHLGSARSLVDTVPIVEATYGDQLSISFDDGAKWRALRAGAVSVGPIAEYRQLFNDNLPRGSFHLNDALEVGGFAERRTALGVAEARLRRAVNGYQGWSGDLSFSTGGPVTSRIMLGGQARLAWADSNFTQESFGLRPSAAGRLGPPQSRAEDFVTVGGELDAAHQVTARARLVLELSADRMVGELPPTPLIAQRDIFTAAFGLTYRCAGPLTERTP